MIFFCESLVWVFLWNRPLGNIANFIQKLLVFQYKQSANGLRDYEAKKLMQHDLKCMWKTCYHQSTDYSKAHHLSSFCFRIFFLNLCHRIGSKFLWWLFDEDFCHFAFSCVLICFSLSFVDVLSQNFLTILKQWKRMKSSFEKGTLTKKFHRKLIFKNWFGFNR